MAYLFSYGVPLTGEWRTDFRMEYWLAHDLKTVAWRTDWRHDVLAGAWPTCRCMTAGQLLSAAPLHFCVTHLKITWLCWRSVNVYFEEFAKREMKLFRSSFAKEVNNNGEALSQCPQAIFDSRYLRKTTVRLSFFYFYPVFMSTQDVLFLHFFLFTKNLNTFLTKHGLAWHSCTIELPWYSKCFMRAGIFGKEQKICSVTIFERTYVDTASFSMIRRFHLLHEATRVAFSQFNLDPGP